MYKRNARGTYVIDRRFKGIGRIAKSSGTNDEQIFKEINVMLDILFNTGKLQFLEAIRDGTTTVMQVYTNWKNQKLNATPTVEATLPLSDMTTWIASYEGVTDVTRKGYGWSISALLKTAKVDDTIASLPVIIKNYKKKMYKAGKNIMFNNVRITVMAYLRDKFGRFSPIYVEVAQIDPLARQVQRPQRAWRVSDILDIMSKLPKDIADTVWTLCCTGMGWAEYTGKWEVQADRILVHGTKMDAFDKRRDRVIPKLYEPTTAAVATKTFRRALKKASNGAMLPYDTRHCYKAWLQEAGIPENRIMQYLGHLPRSMTSRYGQQDITNFLSQDADKMRTYIDSKRTAVTGPTVDTKTFNELFTYDTDLTDKK